MAEQGPSEFNLYLCLKLNEARRAQSERSEPWSTRHHAALHSAASVQKKEEGDAFLFFV